MHHELTPLHETCDPIDPINSDDILLIVLKMRYFHPHIKVLLSMVLRLLSYVFLDE